MKVINHPQDSILRRVLNRKFLFKLVFWAVGEVWLGMIGIDDFADYQDFLYEQDLELSKKNNRTVKLSGSNPMFCNKINDACPIKVMVDKKDSCEKSYLYSSETFNKKCLKLKHFCIKAEILSKLL
ncbi:hypothetical protein [Gloeothece verrucosa]|uniref:Uncharacterized protein n=1 Tax=Gloeothece verrucosa (strain PCC 7822) TaxID=497965 RepID=E0UH26_GLOV7|nr:hypothetical protein [Gloeothece verrucosa]ADN15625.1 conserved hypothetical protein [Gloeothece verrucosa PCC 7822]